MTKKRIRAPQKRCPTNSNIISDEICMPNHSGEHTAGTTDTPVSDRNIANKKYVDDSFPVTHASTTGQTTDDHHAEVHTIVSHDTTATGAELDTLTDNSIANTLHRHSELVASDGSHDPALSVNVAGRVGIGTSSPLGKLHVANAGETKLRLESDTSNDVGIDFYQGANHKWSIYNDDSVGNDLKIDSVNGNVITLDISTGNVGIGTTSPDELLHIKSVGSSARINMESELAGAASGIEFTSPTQKWITFVRGANNDNYEIYDNDATTTRLAIDTSGNVGIGVTDPHSKLEVNGAISSATTTLSAVGPTDNLDVSGVNVVWIDCSSNAVTLGGLVGGVNGQVLHIVRGCTANSATLEHNEGTGNQDIFLHAGADETLGTEYGGWTLICNGSNWYDVSHARHV